MKNLRKTLSVLLLSFLVFSLIPGMAYAQGNEAVTTVNLNFRDKGTVYSNVIGVIPTGKTLTVLQSVGNWSEVTYDNRTGWVATKYLTEKAVTVRTITNLSDAALKAEASADSKNLAAIAKGSSAKVLEVLKDWYKVEVNAKTGYVFSANWIDSPVAGTPVVAEKPAATEGTLEIYKDITVYMNAIDAKAMKNPAGTYAAGEYHIYKNYSGMLNVTRHPGVPGGWINPSQNEDTAVAAPEPVKEPVEVPAVVEPEAAKPETTKPEATKPAAAEPAVEAPVSAEFTLIAPVDTYMNAYDAQNDTNRVGRLVPGKYFVYKNFGGMVNLTKVDKVPGSWIDPAKNVEVQTAPADEPAKVVEPTKPAEEPAKVVEPTEPSKDPVQTAPKTETAADPVKSAETAAPAEVVETTHPDTISSNSIVNLRNGASNISEVLRTLPAGTNAVMVGRDSNWLKIDYKGQIGYSYINFWTVPEETLAKYPNESTKPAPTPEPTEPTDPADPTSPEDTTAPSGKLRVFLDPGHNGAGLGAVSTVTGEIVDEATINFRVAILAKAILEERGYEVFLSKTELSESKSLAERTAIANELNVDIFVSIHGNSFTDPTARGTIGFYAGQKDAPSSTDWQAKSMLLSRTLSESVGRIFGTGKIVKDTSYGISFAVNRLSTMPSVLLELGFITNLQDATIMTSSVSQKDIAVEIANGIDKYFGK